MKIRTRLTTIAIFVSAVSGGIAGCNNGGSSNNDNTKPPVDPLGKVRTSP